MALDASWQNKRVVALAGGVGGAKFAHGLAHHLSAQSLTVIVNVADDFEHYGLHISPDLDTVMYTLSQQADFERGWGLAGETWQMGTMLRTYGEDVWFNLGDRDLATHLLRTNALRHGSTLTAITRRLTQGLGIQHAILPASDDPIATIVQTKELGRLGFQEYFVKHRWQPIVEALIYQGAETAQATPEVIAALDAADVIFICPSNPLLSIEPILSINAIRARIEDRQVPCIAISPLINGKAIKGPTDKLMQELGMAASQLSIAQYYEKLLDGLVIDISDAHEADAVQLALPDLAICRTATYMQTLEDRPMLAERVLEWIGEVIL